MKALQELKKLALALCCAGFLVPAFSQGQQPLSDEEVAAILVTVHHIGIDNARVAKKKSRNRQVVTFAATMIHEHRAAKDRTEALIDKLDLKPRSSAISQQWWAEAEEVEQHLEETKGSDFDRYYMEQEVVFHNKVVAAVNDLLIPETENPELRELLQNFLPALQVHLRQAELLQNSLKSR